MKIGQDFGFELAKNTPPHQKWKLVRTLDLSLPRIILPPLPNENWSGISIWTSQDYPSPPKMKISQDFGFELHKNTPQMKIGQDFGFELPKNSPLKWKWVRTLSLNFSRISPPPLPYRTYVQGMGV